MTTPKLKPRETVILVDDFHLMVEWYRDVLGFKVTKLIDEGMHFGNLETDSGIRIGIGVAKEVHVELGDGCSNAVLLQFEAEDVALLLAHVDACGGRIEHGPDFNQAKGFWYGAFADPEGNPCWVVDSACP